MDQNTYSLYQIKEHPCVRDILFRGYEPLKIRDLAMYRHVYCGSLEPGSPQEALDNLWRKFNLDHPADYTGRSMSVSDIVVLRIDGKTTAHYVDTIGFVEVPEFLPERQPGGERDGR